MPRRLPLVLLVSVLIGSLFGPQEGLFATAETLYFGQLIDASEIGTGTDVTFGINLAFSEFNSRGVGFCNRTLALLPTEGFTWSTSNYTLRAQQLVTSNILGLLGVVGSTSITATIQMANLNQLPNIAPISGTQSLRGSTQPNVFNLRGSQADEALALIQYVRMTKGFEILALVYEDGFAEPTTVDAVLKGCNQTGLMLLKSFRLTSFSMVQATLISLVSSIQPFTLDAVIVVASPIVASAFVSFARIIFRDNPIVYGIVSVGDIWSFEPYLGYNVENVVIAQVVPLASNSSRYSAVQSYRARLGAIGGTPSTFSLEGYLAGRLVGSLVDTFYCDAAVTSDRLLKALRKEIISVGDISVGPYSLQCNQGLRQIWMAIGTSQGFQTDADTVVTFPSGTCSGDTAQVGPKSLVFGQSAPFSGLQTNYGNYLRAGVLAAFSEQNRLGGIGDHHLHLISLDDGYITQMGDKNTKNLLNVGVYGLIGYYGTSIALDVISINGTVGIPLVSPFTGSTTLRTKSPYVVNVRASYADEVNALVNFVTNKFEITDISIFYQDDSFGMEGLNALVAALDAVNLKMLSNGSYPQNTLDVENGLSAIINGALPFVPKAIFIWATGPQASRFIQSAQTRLSSDTVYVCTSVVGDAFVASFANMTIPPFLFVTQVFPLATDTSFGIVQDYLSAMQKMDPNFVPSIVSLEGYVNARLMIAGLSRLDPSDLLNTSAFFASLWQDSVFSLGGLVLGPYSKSCNQGMKRVWISQFTNIGYTPLPDWTFSFPDNQCKGETVSLKTRFLLFGQSAAFSGPDWRNGPALKSGISAAFAAQNRAGGIAGCQLRIVSLDDGYTVAKALANTGFFLRRNVYGLLGYFGTGISNNAANLIRGTNIPMIAPFSGAIAIRTNSPFVINVRPSYIDEVNAMINFLTTHFDNITGISVLYQNDPFGLEGVSALVSAMNAVNLQILSNGSYPTNTLDVEAGLDSIIQGALPFIPEAIIVWAGGNQSAKFIRLALQRLPISTVYFCASIVGEGLLPAYGNTSAPFVYVTQAFPIASDTSYQIINDFHSAMQAFDPSIEPTMVALEGYIAARLVIAGLTRISPSNILNGSAFLDAIYENSVFRLSKLMLGPYDDTCNQGMRQVWLSQVINGQYVPLPNDTFSFANNPCMSDDRSFSSHLLVFGQSTVLSGSVRAAGFGLQQGILAAFNEENVVGGVSGYKLRLLSLDDGYLANGAITNTRILFRRGIFALIGYFGTVTSEPSAVMATDERVPFIGPCTGTATLRNPNLNVINVRASYFDEANAMINFIVTAFGYMRVSIFYQADAFGLQGKEVLTSALNIVGQSVLSTGTYSLLTGDVVPGLNDIQKNALPYIPNVIVVWAVGSVAANFITTAKTRFPPDVIYMCPSIAADAAFLAAIGSNTTNVYGTEILPPLEGSTHPLVKKYLAAMGNMFSTFTPTSYSFEGYVNARLAITVLQRMNSKNIRSGQNFMDTFYANSIFSLDTITLGPYIKGECNQGLRKVWGSRFTGKGYVEVRGTTYDFTGSCLSNPQSTLHAPVMFGLFVDKDAVTGIDFQFGFLALINEISLTGGISDRPVHLVTFSVGPDTSIDDTSKFLVNNNISVIVTTTSSLATLSMLTSIGESTHRLVLTPRRIAANRVRLPMNPYRITTGGSPLDEVYAAARYIQKQLHLTTIGLFYQTSELGSEVIMAAKAAADEFKLVMKPPVAFGSLAEVGTAVAQSSSVDVLLLNAVRSEILVEAVYSIANKRPELPIFIISSDANISAVQERLGNLTSTVYVMSFQQPVNLRSDDFGHRCSAALALLNQSSTAAPSLMNADGYLVGGLLVEIAKYAEKNGLSPFFSTEAFYGSELFTVDSFRLGPYANSTCISRRSNANCQCDQGIHTIWLLRLTSNLSVPFEIINEGTLSFDTCGVVLTPPETPVTSLLPVVIGVAVGLGVVAVLILLLIGRLIWLKRQRRALALKKAPDGNVAIAFTDVQDSTKLWETAPGMKEALDMHNDVIRRLISQHQGYEVKTQGDSFMVAFPSADCAVRWAIDVQEDLLHLNWPDDILTHVDCPIAKASEGEYFLRRGLQVRIGMHVGFPELEYNPRTNSVDYFGSIVNGAARIEALGAGGQILVSTEFHDQLTREASKDLVFMFLGQFLLKGMIMEQGIFQVSSQRLAARLFPVIDPEKIARANYKGAQNCEKCNRALICPRCSQPHPHRFSILPDLNRERRDSSERCSNAMSAGGAHGKRFHHMPSIDSNSEAGGAHHPNRVCTPLSEPNNKPQFPDRISASHATPNNLSAKERLYLQSPEDRPQISPKSPLQPKSPILSPN